MSRRDPARLSDLLARLEDIVEPPAVSWVPQTPLSIASCVLLSVSIIFLAAWIFRRYRANRYRREALAELDEIERKLAKGDLEAAASIAVVLRRAAIHIEGRERVASMDGPAWLRLLDEHVPNPLFTTGTGPLLLEIPYAPTDRIASNESVRAELVARARRWVRSHRA